MKPDHGAEPERAESVAVQVLLRQACTSPHKPKETSYEQHHLHRGPDRHRYRHLVLHRTALKRSVSSAASRMAGLLTQGGVRLAVRRSRARMRLFRPFCFGSRSTPSMAVVRGGFGSRSRTHVIPVFFSAEAEIPYSTLSPAWRRCRSGLGNAILPAHSAGNRQTIELDESTQKVATTGRRRPGR
jgi:hypothetical protein